MSDSAHNTLHRSFGSTLDLCKTRSVRNTGRDIPWCKDAALELVGSNTRPGRCRRNPLYRANSNPHRSSFRWRRNSDHRSKSRRNISSFRDRNMGPQADNKTEICQDYSRAAVQSDSTRCLDRELGLGRHSHPEAADRTCNPSRRFPCHPGSTPHICGCEALKLAEEIIPGVPFHQLDGEPPPPGNGRSSCRRTPPR
jgi:hypothetical protein